MTNTTALPKLLRLTDPGLREQLQALPESTALIGISTTGRAIAVDLDAESPHVPPPTPDPQPAAAPADSRADAWSTTPTTAVPDPVSAPAAERDFVADAWGLNPSAADPGDATPAATSPPAPDPVDDDQAVGLREAHERLLPYTLEALRYARANDRTFPKPVGKRGAGLLYRVGDLKKWARNRPRAATGTTDLD